MAVSTHETERTYESASDDCSWPQSLTGLDQVVSLVGGGTQELEAVYYDTDDLRLSHTGATLRRRTGGTDAGWHLKLPLTDDSREEVRAPLSSGDIPGVLSDLVLSRTRGAALRPVMRILTTRTVHHLLDAGGEILAELSVDAVSADALLTAGARTAWTEREVELADGADHALLDGIEKILRHSGLERSRSPSKMIRALEETTTSLEEPQPEAERATAAGVAAGSAGDHVLAYLRHQTATLRDLDPAARRGLPDAVHQMRTSIRRLRGCLRTYRSVLAREATDPLRRELKWLAGELGVERDHEVLRDRFTAAVRELPGEQVLGPVNARLELWDAREGHEGRRRTLQALSSRRYLRLLDALQHLTEDPPLRAKAAGKPEKVMVKALRKDYGRLARRMGPALDLAPGPERGAAIHNARKTAKRLRYAAEAARPALGKPAERLSKRTKAVQRLAGAHHDSVVAGDELRSLAVSAHAAGEPGFTWGLLAGQERAAAADCEHRLPETWARVRTATRLKALYR
ncbi:CYTH and CHAD domain-containing protein [Streptomyces sp. AP-93]|uniref:CYTH and CHAD domain-containing protein n=1 Tax=Streptomyces sp. AP-93 TaxID=2929048 RepID=UPI001FAE8505|nr:CYTH and CHAD domain-containing protein [Streptomyces sp. AP-93]MCJ0871947.1 CYTH and CHAD domain-containing protein [Streptomyces sp. AP-93]